MGHECFRQRRFTMFQLGAFAYMTNDFSEHISITTSVRGEFADWRSGIPGEVERSPQRGEVLNDADGST